MDSRTLRSITNGYTNKNIDCIDDLCYDLYVSSHPEENHNDCLEDLPAVDMNLSYSGSTSNSGSEQSTRKNTRTNNDKAVEGSRNKKSDRESAKQKTAVEKAAKKQMQELNKIYKPGECMKYMQVEVHPSFLEKWYAGDIEREMSPSGAKIVTSLELFDPSLVLWKRSVPQTLVSKDGELDITPRHEVSDRGLYVMIAADAAQYICEHKLSQHIATVNEIANVKVTLVIFGEQEYFKTASKKRTNNQVMSEVDLEMAISDLLVSTGCDTVVLNQANELALLILQFTKAIAEAPYKQLKRACDEQADFYMRGDNKKCVSVDKEGNGLSCLWQQMLAVLPQSSLETSRALCAQYKTPLDLYETLKLPEGVKTVAELGVTRSAVPGSRARRIGPEFARKLHTLMTAEDGNMLIE
ncbi:PREDICTED: crossover junction endonuclease EME1 [Papilio xuthus]|uniref:Crossover junction endonuclease EME1 n=1 Tax=Papilio xuthus TaxID=66420 RepID=A0AAJ7E8W7_PAPXU|nr:PREDICTED: crossover junction endonuclease EME1 [Papilio xuthus]